jgi:hypothetical protein
VDPNNARARAQIESVSHEEFVRARQRRKRIAAAGILVLALGVLYGMTRHLARRPRRTPKAA